MSARFSSRTNTDEIRENERTSDSPLFKIIGTKAASARRQVNLYPRPLTSPLPAKNQPEVLFKFKMAPSQNSKEAQLEKTRSEIFPNIII